MRKTRSIISLILCAAMLLALLPVMAMTAAAETAVGDYLYGLGSFDEDISIMQLDTEPHENNFNGKDGYQTETGNVVSDYADTDIFTWTETEGVGGSGALKIVPTGGSGNAPATTLASGLTPGETYTVSFKFKFNEMNLTLNLWDSEYTTRFANIYVLKSNTINTAYATEGETGDWHTATFNFRNTGAAWTGVHLVITPIWSAQASAENRGAVKGDGTTGGWLIIDDLTVTAHEHADTNTDGYCDNYVYASEGTMINIADDVTKGRVVCQPVPVVEETVTDLYEGHGTFDAEADKTELAGTSTYISFDSSVDANGNADSGSLKLDASTGWDSLETLFYVDPVIQAKTIDPDKVYVFQFKIRVYENSTQSYVAPSTAWTWHSASSGSRFQNVYYANFVERIEGSDWYQFTFPFSGGGVLTSFKYYFQSNRTVGYIIHFDDMALVEHEKHVHTDIDGACDFVYNKSNGTTGYSAVSCSEKEEPEDWLYGLGSMAGDTGYKQFLNSSHTYDSTLSATADGTGALKYNSSSTGTKIPVEEGAIYTLRVKLYADTLKTSGVVWNLYSQDSSGTQVGRIANAYTTVAAVNTWQEFYFKIKPNGSTITIALRNDAGGNLWIDEMTLVKHTEHDDGETEDSCCEYKHWLFVTSTGGTTNNVSTETVNVENSTLTCGANMPKFTGANATLGDVVELNMYAVTQDPAMTVDLSGDFSRNTEQTETVGLALVDDGNDATANTYKVTVKLPAKNMSDVITATLKNGDEVVGSVSTSVRDYVMKGITTGIFDDASTAAAKAMLNYGAAAQVQQGYKTDCLANAFLSAADRFDQTETDDYYASIVGVPKEEIVVEPPAELFLTPTMSTSDTYLDQVYVGADAQVTMTDLFGSGMLYWGSGDANVKPYINYYVRSSTAAEKLLFEGNVLEFVPHTEGWGGAWIRTKSISVEEGKTYTISYWKYGTFYTDPYAYIVASSGNTDFSSLETDTAYYNGWKKTTVDYTAAATETIELRIMVVIKTLSQAGSLANISVKEKVETKSDELLKTSDVAQIATISLGAEAYGWRIRGAAAAVSYDEVLNKNVLTIDGTTGAWTRVAMTSDTVLKKGKTYRISFLGKCVNPDGEFVDNMYFSGHGVSLGDATGDYNGSGTGWVAGESGEMDATTGWKQYVYTYSPSDVVAGQSNPCLTFATRTDYTISITDISFTEIVPETDPVEDYLPAYTFDTANGGVENDPRFAGYTLIMKDQTNVRLYFNTASSAGAVTAVTVKPVVDGVEGDAVTFANPNTGEAVNCHPKGNMLYVDLPAVGAADLDTGAVYNVYFNEDTAAVLTISNLSTIAPAAVAASRTSTATAQRNLCIAMILYAEAVNAL